MSARSLSSFLCTATCWLAAGNLWAQEAVESLEKLRDSYQKHLAKQHEPVRAWLKGELLSIEKAAQSRGELDLVIAVRDARVAYTLGANELQSASVFPIETASLAKEHGVKVKPLQSLRERHDARVRKIDQAAQRVYIAALGKLQATLVEKGMLAEAEAVRAESQSIERQRGWGVVFPDLPEGTIEFRGHHYLFVDRKVTWHKANEWCEEHGGHLATIADSAEHDFIESSFGGKEAWLGAWKAKEGEWRWATGEEMEFTAWGEDQPDNYKSGEDHLCLRKDSLWNDYTADGKLRFLCEWSPPK